MGLVGIDHVQLAMPAGQEAIAHAFYADVLGLTPIAKPESLAARGGCWFAAPGFQIHLGVDPAFAAARKAHPALLAADLAACRRALAAAGVPIEDDSSVPGVRRLYATDPFGNRLELIQHGDGFSQRNT